MFLYSAVPVRGSAQCASHIKLGTLNSIFIFLGVGSYVHKASKYNLNQE